MNRKDGFWIGLIIGFFLWTVISGFPWSKLGVYILTPDVSGFLAKPAIVIITVIGIIMGIGGTFSNSALLGRPWRDYIFVGIMTIADLMYVSNVILLFLEQGQWLLP